MNNDVSVEGLLTATPPVAHRCATGDAGLRIAMVAPPYFTVPPAGYGGVEAIVADLVDALVDRGHHITLIGAGAPGTRAQQFVPTTDEACASQLGQALPEVVHTARVAEILHGCDVDLIHEHTLTGPLLARGRRTPTVVTVHGPVRGQDGEYYRALGDSARLIAISEAQRGTAPDLHWLATVHNGIAVDTFPFRAVKENFALFLGRFHEQKAPHLAIDAARAAGLPAVLAGKCSEPVELAYFEAEIAPRLGPDVTVLGPADASAKRELLARACCLLFPICWDEPFGLVMVEALACGTPVVALRRGSVAEILVDGRTGAICDDPSGLADAIGRARELDPAVCRAEAERRFTAEAMAAGYEAAYRRVLQAGPGSRTHSAPQSLRAG